MPSDTDHIQQARRNAQFLSTFDLAATPHAEWVIIVAFYTAVHLVEAHFARANLHWRRHEDRNRQVERQFPEISTDYMLLYKESRKARYDCLPVTSAQASRAVHNFYEPVRIRLCNLLGIAM